MNTKNSIIYLITVLLTYSLFTTSAFSERRRQVFTGTRPLGMAGAFLTVNDDGHTISWNPAGMPFVRHQELAFTHNDSYGLGINENNLIYLLPITDRHAVGIDWFNTVFDDKELDFSENRVNLAYSYNFFSTFSLGASLKYFSQSQGLDGITFSEAGGLGVDVGLIFSPIENLRLGAVALDATDTWVKFSKSENKELLYHRNIRFGASYKPIDSLVMAADYDEGLHLGAEYWLANIIGMRGGVYNNFATDDGLRYALGGSLKYSFFQNASLRLDYAFQSHPVLPETHRLTAGIAFELTPSLVKIEKIEPQPVFATLYTQYSDKSMGEVTLRNKQKKPLKVTVSVFIPEYMEGPTEIAKDILLIGATGDELVYSEPIPIKPAFSSEILGVEQNVPTQMKITVTYEHLSRTRRVEKNEQASIYRPGMLPIGKSVKPIAALIDPYESTVETFASEVVSQYGARENMMSINKNISKALHIYNALNCYGVKYNIDPDNPYGSVPIDSVTYPGRMLHKKVGDCDDETALYAALLESVGIHTRLIGVPEHVYVMFNTGVHKRKAASLSLPEEKYIIIQDSSYVWIPVEVTRFGKTERSNFLSAWEEGLKEYHQWWESDKIEVVDVHQAWEEGYQYNHLPGDITEVAPPSRTELTPLITHDVVTLNEQRDTYLANLQEEVKQHPEDLAIANKLAKTFALLNQHDQAIQQFKAILERQQDNATALNNLGNVYVMQEKYEEAKIVYRRAREADPEDAGIRLNEGLVYKISGDDERGNQFITEAIQKAGGAGPAQDDLCLSSDEHIRGEATRMVANQIRLLITNLAGEGGSTVKLSRASEVGGGEEQEFYLYWKE